MKKFKKSMIMLLSLALVLSVCVSILTACGEDPKTQYNVSVGNFDTNKGNITIDKEKVDAGEEVTVSVTAKEGYEIKDFYIGSNNLTQDFYSKNNMTTSKDYTSGVYTFKVNKDSVIRAEFQDRGTNAKDDYIYTLACEYDTLMGEVAVTPERSKFAEGETVSLSIVLNSNYVIKSILVNNTERISEAKQAGNNYTYNFAFNITENSTVKIVMNYDVTKITDITADKFDDAVKSNEWVLVDFWSHDCGYCTSVLGPSLKDLTKKNKIGNVRVIKLELDSLYDRSSAAYKIKKKYETEFGYGNDQGLPFVVLFNNGKAVAHNVGVFGTSATTSEQPTIDWLKDQGVKI